MTNPRLAFVIPAHNEAANLPGLVADIRAIAEDFDAEVIVVNDGSGDNTTEVLTEMAAAWSRLSIVTHATSQGQSAALRSGIRAARAPVIATLDGDGQNPPENLRGMVECFIAAPEGVGMVQGERINRKDTFSKRLASRVANAIRGFLLRDGCRDSGCALRVFWRQSYLDLPWFKHLHRFMPALMRRDGWDIISYPVSHAPREWGQSHYSNWQRGLAGVPDLIGVSWLIWRAPNSGPARPWWRVADEKALSE